MKSFLTAVAVAFLLHSCCTVDVPPQEFRRLPLAEQIATWERFRAGRCGTEISGQYLDGMALHGVAAADAMEPFLSGSDKNFPPVDAAWVITFVASHGADLRSHPATKRLRSLAVDAPDPNLRKAASFAVHTIDATPK